MRKLVACGLIGVVGAAALGLVLGWPAGAAALHTRADLAAPQTVQGYLCDKGPVWYYRGGRLLSCMVAKETKFGELAVPAGSWIHLEEDGTPEYVFLARDTQIGNVTCRGNGPEGYTTTVYAGGKLKECWLSGDQVVQGVPCQGAAVLGNASAAFRENGRLHSCVLSQDYKSFRRGQRLVLEY
jgi:hypothetical protein